MERLCGYMILGGVALAGYGGYQWWTGGDAAALLFAGGVALFILGFWLSGRYGEDGE